MRYRGQRHNIKVPISGLADAGAIRAAFERDYQRRYGHADAAAPAEFQALASLASRACDRPDLARLPRAAAAARGAGGKRPVYFGDAGGMLETPVYDRYALAPGFARRSGPA